MTVRAHDVLRRRREDETVRYPGNFSNPTRKRGDMEQDTLAPRARKFVELCNDNLDFATLRATNLRRALRWHDDFDDPLSPTHWNAADWSNAMQGEAGEAGNFVKKLRRLGTMATSVKDAASREELIAAVAAEIADTIIYADLLGAYLGIDVGAAVREKFNLVSEREGFPERL